MLDPVDFAPWLNDVDKQSLLIIIFQGFNLFIKLELNNFLLPPLLSIVFVQECSVVFRKVFDEGRLERRTFLPEKWRAWVRVSKISGNCSFTCLQFFFRRYDGF